MIALTRRFFARSSRRVTPRPFTRMLLPALAVATLLPACTYDADIRRARAGDDIVVRDIEPIFNGLIGAETTIRGIAPRLVSGIGLVVGLNGTGSADVPASVRARLEDQMTRYGVGTARGGRLADVSPSELINSPNTAVVLVQAVIRPGQPEGSTFDVRVSAWPNSSTTSLEGGRLYTTELRRGIPDPNAPDTPALAEARGDVYLNPFSQGDGLAPLTVGRVIAGGDIIETQPLVLTLDNPSHARARQIVDAINSRFPRADRLPTAIGLDDESLELNVPPGFASDIDLFIQLVRFTRVNRAALSEWARRYADEMVERPELAEDLSWALRGIGPAAIPVLRPLYDHPDIGPRVAAIRAGAFLQDPTVRPHIERLATDGPVALRAAAIGLFRFLRTDPRVSTFLRARLDDEDPNIRVAAYEALRDLNDPLVVRAVGTPDFDIHLVPSNNPTLYVTQQNAPIVVIFGRGLDIERPAFAEVWDGRLLLNADRNDRKVDLMYRDPLTRRVARASIDPSLVELVRTLAYDPKPGDIEPGLGLNYSQTVRVLAAVVDNGAVDAAFFPEADRLRLALLRARDLGSTPRPELAGETLEDMRTLNEPPSAAELARQTESAEQQLNDIRPRIVRFPEPTEDDDD